MTSRIGPYALIERWAEGGMAEVYLAQRDGTQQLSVLKRLQAERKNDGSTAEQRLYREAHLATLLDHPNIARLQAAGDDDGRFYLVYELIAGETLASIKKRFAERSEAIPLDMIWTIAFATLDALDYAHNLRDTEGKLLQLVHRDVTPNNLMLDYSGVLKLIDFGVARAKVDSLRTAPGFAIGTVRYFAPEQVYGEEIDRRTDVYAFGAVLYELLTGEVLVPGNEPVEVMKHVAEDHVPQVRALRPDVPDGVQRVLERALAKRIEARYPSAAHFAEALRGISGIVPATRERLREVMELMFGAEIIRANIRRGQAAARAPVDPQAVMHTRVAAVAEIGASPDLAPLPQAEAITPAPGTTRLAIGAALLLAATLSLLLLLYVRRTEAPPSVVAPPQQDVEIAEVEVPRAVARPGAKKQPPVVADVEPPATPRTTKRAAPAKILEQPPPPPPQQVEQPQPYAHIKKALRRLRNEHDGALFDQTATEILAEAEKLSDRDRRAIITRVDNAQRAQNTDELEEAFDKLLRAQSTAAHKP